MDRSKLNPELNSRSQLGQTNRQTKVAEKSHCDRNFHVFLFSNKLQLNVNLKWASTLLVRMVVTMKTFMIFAKCMKVLIYFFRKTHMKTFRFHIPLTLTQTLFQITSRWIKSSFRWDNISTQLFWTKNAMQQLFWQMVYILSVYGGYMRTCVRQPETGSIPILNELHHVLDASLKLRTPKSQSLLRHPLICRVC